MAEAEPLVDWRARRLWLAAAGSGAAIAACILWIDLPLALWLKANVSQPVFDAFFLVSKLGNGGIWAGVALALWAAPWARQAWRRGDAGAAWRATRPRALQAGTMLASLALIGVLVNILKHALGRYRPAKFFATGEHEFSFFVIFQKSDSFPSGHAATICGAMLCLGFVYPKLRWLWAAVALVVSLSRLIVHKHYLGDVVAGAALALAVCLLVRRAADRRRRGGGGFRTC